MFARLVSLALSQRLMILVAAFGLLLAGIDAYRKLPVDAFPDISPTQVKIILKAPGMTPEEVENQVIAPLEMELLGIPKQAMLRSTAKYAIADITLDFQEGTDVYWARQQTAERLANAMDALPAGVSGGLSPISTPLSDVYMFTLEGPGLSLEERRTLLDWTVRPALRGLPGVADVNVLGGRARAFEVVPDPAALAASGLTTASLRQALEAANRNDGAGRLIEGEEALVVRVVGAAVTLDDLRATPIALPGGGSVRLGDIAEVRTGALTRYGAVTEDGRGEAVQAIVIALKGADAKAVVAQVKARLAEVQTSLPKGVTISPFYDRSELVERATGTVTKALMEATILVVVLLLLFLGELRAAVVVAVTLPFAALTTFLLMRTFGLSANLMSLGGLAIAIGMLVDAAVVVVENTVERLNSPDIKGSRKLHLIHEACREVATPVVSGVIIICLVFMPLLSLQGLEGKLFAPVALTIVFALGSSLALSFTLIPVLSSFLLKPQPHHDSWLMRRVGPAYSRLLERSLARPMPVVAAAVVGMAAAGAGYVFIGKSFMPTMDEGAILMQLAKLPSVNLDESTRQDMAVQRAVLERVPEVKRIVARVGSDELGLDPMGLNETDSFLVLAPKSEWRRQDKAWLTDELRRVVADFSGVDAAFTQPIEMRVSEMLTGSRGDLAVKVFGPDLATLGDLAARIEAVLKSTPGAADVYTVAGDSLAYLQFDMNRAAAGRSGLSIEDVQTELRAQIEGAPAGVVFEPGRRTPILVRGPEAARAQPEQIEQLEIATPDGGLARLSELAAARRVDGPLKIDRENASRFAVIQAYVTGRDLVGFVSDAQARVAREVPLPQGYRLAWGGQFENQRRAAARLGIVVPAALGLIFLVLFATLRSMRQALLILANIPFALIGGMLALWASGQYLSVPASVGFIALLGIAVLNGLVLVSHFNDLIQRGLSIGDAVVEGSRRRLRPVLMTASITALGLVPLLLATGPGSEIQKPLAIVVVGGLVTSTLLTLILLPILYRRFGLERGAAAREVTA
ncbi:efflux RND transporter permease subunit [Phenylobacterium kunshanense]|uniref:CusA/CzcA family heavy metal efflux RND transporter n=1 Tax=Phenylobacterium kunshanense TaxID=1445034 RepID=A0A328BHY8_9CAUL|nr:efflux RND transporter permease subunit [Phenylobacterium kunshanense]RAK66229.1 CusA/CzcA family heavy metal efflux RND transporter [Phenylobacterium kunshanense]